MPTESIDSDYNEAQGYAVETEAGSISFALDALSHLHGDEPAAAPAQPAAAEPPRGDGGEAPAQPPDSLQSALDWYKDWLSSI